MKFENVGLRYGSGREIVQDINFELKKSTFQFITGPSGSGKTTLINLILNIIKPTRGTITAFGKEMNHVSNAGVSELRRRLGIVFQDFKLLDHLTVFENVALSLKARGKQSEQFKSEIVELLQWIGLGERLYSYPPLLSGGEKQRTAIARAIIHKPDLLLADEPTANVDPTLARRLIKLFIELNHFGTSVVIATHDTSLIETIECTRLELSNGRLTVNHPI